MILVGHSRRFVPRDARQSSVA